LKDTKNTGRRGEDKAADFLQKSGWTLLERNFRFRFGEIDIIALDGETLVFIEVKAWSSYPIESLEYGVNKKKQLKIIETAKYFLVKHRKYSDMSIRFDILFIKADVVTHIKNAFSESV
jgi:putative endonuclease